MHKRKLALFLAIVLALALFGGALAAGQAFSPTISWWTVDNGGGQSSATGYTLNGTIGQPDAGPLMTGGAYSLSGGYWSSSAPSTGLYLPLMLRR
jgi:hypothetical protein